MLSKYDTEALSELVDARNSELSDVEHNIKTIEQKRNSLNAEMSSIRNIVSNNQLIRVRLESMITEKKGSEKRRQEIATQIDGLGKIEYNAEHHDELKERLSTYRKIINERAEIVGRLQRAPKLREQLQQKLSEQEVLHSEKVVIENELANIKYTKEDMAAITADIMALNNRLEKMRGDQRYIEANQHQLTEQMKRANELLTRLVEERQELEGMQTALNRHEALKDALNAFKRSMISRIRPMLELHASNLLEAFTDGKYCNIVIDEDYGVHIDKDGRQTPLNIFSGGEKDLVNIGLRMAISRLLTRKSGETLKFVVLDEPFGSLDINYRENVMSGLLKLHEDFAQIFLVTHVDDLKESLQTVYRVTENGDGTSSVKEL